MLVLLPLCSVAGYGASTASLRRPGSTCFRRLTLLPASTEDPSHALGRTGSRSSSGRATCLARR
ncbi:hypothetical protein PF005_g30781 [Phytophthora fragariae]|uniref:RxLR effector protein n=1 Tax=Phytophthora fragariae TaxID=53985 RepID=A0A6A3E8G9_9STRA|nr:hypothetical protein PF003_g40855 [Phytophthora fragariae]KAE8926208.1 hypothetical protein PF009_g23593 [Phytophthora fragariae]KAE9060839.1 hypothetical protein PF010_g30053 [Phytophthora fragariae]KAE9067633.1 hypothetical protein PF007_g27997 [Phytophthora fragariae]KAE9085295.1 hypothetical protein PF006_g26287 [Phytophthora fragariae]